MNESDKKPPANQGQDKGITIVVNAEQHTVAGRELTFEQIVQIAFPNNPQGGNWLYTVLYRRGGGNKPEGTLVKGESVKLKDGMVFNVSATDKS